MREGNETSEISRIKVVVATFIVLSLVCDSTVSQTRVVKREREQERKTKRNRMILAPLSWHDYESEWILDFITHICCVTF